MQIGYIRKIIDLEYSSDKIIQDVAQRQKDGNNRRQGKREGA